MCCWFADEPASRSIEQTRKRIANTLPAIISSSDESLELRSHAMNTAVEMHDALGEDGQSAVVGAILQFLQSKQETAGLRATALDSVLDIVRGAGQRVGGIIPSSLRYAPVALAICLFLLSAAERSSEGRG